MINITQVNLKKEMHKNHAKNVVVAIKDAIKKSGIPMRVSIKTVPVSGDMNYCYVLVRGDAFSFSGVTLLRNALVSIL